MRRLLTVSLYFAFSLAMLMPSGLCHAQDREYLHLDIEEEARSALIPSLLLQPLVENAIKYGIARSDNGGNLRIAAKVFAGEGFEHERK